MQEHKSHEEELKALIEKAELTIAKLNKIISNVVKIGLPALGTVILAFLGSTYYNNNRVTSLEATFKATKMSNEEVLSTLDKYAKKTEIIFLQNDLFELNDAIFAKNSWIVPIDIDTEYNRILKRFNGDVSRSATQ